MAKVKRATTRGTREKYHHGDLAPALREAALAILREVGSRRPEAYSLSNLASLRQAEGRLREARAHFEAALVLSREVGDRHNEGSVLWGLGEMHVDAARSAMRGQRHVHAASAYAAEGRYGETSP